jgi:hypothetical protein
MDEKRTNLVKNINNSNLQNLGLSIDYSKFQCKFNNNNQSSNAGSKKHINNFIKNDSKKENDNEISKQKNLDQFLNVSGILNESQSSLLNNSAKNKDLNKRSKMGKINFITNLDDISIGQNEDENLITLNYNDLIKNNIKNPKTTVNSKEKKKYVKFLKTNFAETERKKDIDENIIIKNNLIPKCQTKRENHKKNIMNSYVQMIKKNNLIEKRNHRGRKDIYNRVNNDNLFIEDNNKCNNSITTFLGISNVPPNNTLTMGNSTNNKNKNILFSNFNKRYDEDLNKSKVNHHHKNISYDKYFNISDLDLMLKRTKNNKKKNQNFNKVNKSSFLISSNNNKYNNNIIFNNYNSSLKIYESSKQIKNDESKDEVMILLDNIKNKYKNKENKYINQQKYMKNEIDILREKLKKLSVKEALHQVEIEKLKRTNNCEENNNCEKNQQNYFEQKLDSLIEKHNNTNQNNNENLSLFSKKNKFDKLLHIFNLEKNFLAGENISEEENINYEEIFNKYPQLKEFIQILIDKYNNEKEYRIRLEEKTIEIFTNDMKTINNLEKKIKKYESNKHKINSSLNISSDGGLSDNNITKNSCKSCDKIL